MYLYVTAKQAMVERLERLNDANDFSDCLQRELCPVVNEIAAWNLGVERELNDCTKDTIKVRLALDRNW